MAVADRQSHRYELLRDLASALGGKAIKETPEGIDFTLGGMSALAYVKDGGSRVRGRPGRTAPLTPRGAGVG